jgi:hypothetical protein
LIERASSTEIQPVILGAPFGIGGASPPTASVVPKRQALYINGD